MESMTSREPSSQQSKEPNVIAAIDTSSDHAGIALFDGERIDVIAWHAARNHTVTTLEQLDHLMQLKGIEPDALAAIAVAIGPGSFSALRVGLSIAKGLAFSLNIPVLGIPTTDAIAAHLAWTERPVIAVMTAGRGRVVWRRYSSGNGQNGPSNTTVAELRDQIGDAQVAGENELLGDIPAVALPAGARVEQIARIGWRRFIAGERDDPVSLEPIYVHGRRRDSIGI